MTGLAFSPGTDNGGGSRMLAVAQTDGIVYVYRLSGERKSICKKFPSPLPDGQEEVKEGATGVAGGVPVTCIVWPSSHVRALRDYH